MTMSIKQFITYARYFYLSLKIFHYEHTKQFFMTTRGDTDRSDKVLTNNILSKPKKWPEKKLKNRSALSALYFNIIVIMYYNRARLENLKHGYKVILLTVNTSYFSKSMDGLWKHSFYT